MLDMMTDDSQTLILKLFRANHSKGSLFSFDSSDFPLYFIMEIKMNYVICIPRRILDDMVELH